ncbi:LrgB family protein [Psychromonas sp. B3M02]|uniref:LrgB family protein n=1 Tax=Psychromonas sp. B3M02 TaxID=2267226 RepID=UPI000DEAA90F|nr:LrgB family protein [Psychromonas sp. B3M02]RBW41332.1 LrgB family protein [Psychromonas sp. B3M02]
MFIYIATPLTLLFFFLAKKLYSMAPNPLFNPVLVTIFSLIAILLLFAIPYQDYQQGTGVITALLEPAIVALAVPLYLQLKVIKARLKYILLSCLLSVFVAFFCAFYVMPLLGADALTAASFAGQSVTTPIAMEISKNLQGIVSLTAAMVIFAGIIGASIGLPFLRLTKVKDPQAVGVAIGCASHALGTAKVLEENEESGAFSSIALILCAILSALIMPVLYQWLIL